MTPVSQLPPKPNAPGTLLLVGGSVRAAAQDASRAGWQIVAVDRYGDADLRSFCNRWLDYNDRDWLTQLRGESGRVDYLVGLGGFERTREVEAICAEFQVPILFPTQPALVQINHPACLAKLAQTVGIQFPETWQPDEISAALRCVSGHSVSAPSRSTATCSPPEHTAIESSPRYLLKPIDHAGGIGIRFTNLDEPVPPDHWLQRYHEGIPIGASYLALPASGDTNAPHRSTVHLLGICRSLIANQHPDQPFLYQGSVLVDAPCDDEAGGPLALSAPIRQAIQQTGTEAAQQFELAGLFNIDFLLTSQGLVLLELNPRYSASMELHGIDLAPSCSLMDWHVRACRGDLTVTNEIAAHLVRERLPPNANMTRPPRCKRIVYAIADCSFDLPTAENVLNELTLANEPLGRFVEYRLADLPAVQPYSHSISAGQPICTLLLAGSASCRLPAEALVQLADEAAERLAWELAAVIGRTDGPRSGSIPRTR